MASPLADLLPSSRDKSVPPSASARDEEQDSADADKEAKRDALKRFRSAKDEDDAVEALKDLIDLIT